VRVVFAPDTNDVASATNLHSHVQLEWEPDPSAQPDVFQAIPSSRWDVDQINDTVAIQTVRMIDPTAEPSSADDPDFDQSVDNANMEVAPDATALARARAETDDADASSDSLSITFNPDGSSDSAEVTLASRADGDDRLMVVRLEGFTGTVSREEQDGGSAPDRSQALSQTSSDPSL
jgi:hypothetical protein